MEAPEAGTLDGMARQGIGTKNIEKTLFFQKFTKVHETCGKGVRSVWECISGLGTSVFVVS